MNLLLASLELLVISGVLALVLRASRPLSTAIGSLGCVAGCAVGLVGAGRSVTGENIETLVQPWAVPGGSFALGIDALSAFFLLPILGLSALAAVYAVGYFQDDKSGKSPGLFWFFYNLLAASMALVVLARNGILFLMAWETMALSSFFLVVRDDEKAVVRAAGRTYLVAMHLGTAFLFGMFTLLGRNAASLDFHHFGGLTGTTASIVFALALVGFGAKAGFVPFHVWLPEAHPAAPSPVSAVMSGVMIKTGIYGLVRVLTFLGPAPVWWGWLLAGIGVVCAVYGVVFALAQHDLKRLLAYCSVENIGIIATGLGVGLIGLSTHHSAMAALGFAGGLLHVLNHAVFKGLLFLGAGSVIHATGTGEINHLGGLVKRMPRTGLTFLIGAAAISGLPPLNGFVSEFVIFLGSFHGVTATAMGLSVSALAVIAGLALVSGVAAACFSKAFGIVFLGEPRSEHAHHAHEVNAPMVGVQVVLAAACIGIGLAAPWMVALALPAVSVATGLSGDSVVSSALPTMVILSEVSLVFAIVVSVALVLALVRRGLLAGRVVGESGTWDCGYAAPTARMQYTASSFAQPLTELFRGILCTRTTAKTPEGLFPETGRFHSESPDVCMRGLYRPLFSGYSRVMNLFRPLQHGNLHLYVLYIAVALLVLLIWKLR